MRDIMQAKQCLFQPKPGFTPINYRETGFIFGKKVVMVAALAKPGSFDQDPESVMAYLKEQGINTIFGLEPSRKFRKIAEQYGLVYLNVGIPDFTAPDISLYEQIYEQALIDTKLGKKIAIHCLGGNGRTGTVLAALKLKERAADDSFYETELADDSINLPYDPEPVQCTTNVAKAIHLIRGIKENQQAVEVKEQVSSLMLYEQQLRYEHELQTSKGSFMSLFGCCAFK